MRITLISKTIICAVFSALICCTNAVYGQSYELRFNHLNSEDGLSDNRAKCFIQDQRGFIWIGTNNGLNRYDGHEFISFNTESPGKSKICGNSISSLDIDEKGRIWIATEDNGFCSLDPEELEFTSYKNIRGDTLSFQRINDIIVINDNEIGIGIQNGFMAKFHVQEDSLEIILSDKAATAYEFEKIENEKIVSVGLQGGIRISSEDNLLTLVDIQNPKTRSLNSIHAENQKFWTGSWGNTLCEYDRIDETWTHHLLEKDLSENTANIISEITRLDSGRIIIGTDNNGLFIFNEHDKNCQSISRNEKDASAPRGISIHALFQDKDGRIWIGSNAGIDIYDPLLNQFEIAILPELNGAKIYDIIEEGQNLFFASTDGLLKISKDDKTLLLRKDLKFRCFAKSPDNSLFVGSNKALFELSPEPFKINKLPPIDIQQQTYTSLDNLSGSTFSSIHFYQDNGETWLCAMAYGLDLIIIDLDNESGYAFLPSTYINGQLSTSHLIRRFYPDSKNRLWACSRNRGLIRIDQEFTHDSLTSRGPEKNIKNGLKSHFYSTMDGMPSTNVFDIVEDPDGSFWLSTIGNGLIHFNENNEVKFSEIDLEYKTIHGLEIDKNGNLWGVTSNGILFYNPSTKKHKLFNQIDGLKLDGMVGYWYKNEKGELYKGLNGSYIKFQPEDISLNMNAAPAYLTHLAINNESADSLLLSENIDLNHDQNFITFEFASPSYTNSKLNAYDYILEGVDPKWRTIQGKNEAVYTSLQPGVYAFKIRAANNDGFWGDYKTLTTLNISPPWWRTWWFYTLIVLFIATILYALYRYRIAQLVRFYEMRNQIARDLHDDIGSTLGSISFYSEVAEQQLRKKGESSAEDVVQKIGSTSREMMDSIGDIVWAVNPKNDTIEKIVDRMKNFATPLLSSKQIEAKFNIDSSLNSEKLGMEKRKNMFLIFKECIHNSLKYSNCKKVNIDLLKDGKEVFFIIQDNGIGFDLENTQAYNGNGMVNIRERAKEMNAGLNIESVKNEGTTVKIRFDLN